MVGDYRLLTKIGEGGMGVVHLAQAPDGDRVALKVLRPHIVGDDEARERLAREVASLRRVRSPRVAEIVDADPWGETPFVATRYVPGLSLHEHIRQEGPVEGGDLRWFAAGLAEAVIAVHSVGVLHRDIKPSNILLEGRSPVLIDFGLARLAEDPRLTATGWLLGTPGYLAPEILYGDDATAASDAHSWAATVVFAATGRPPFGRGPAMAIMDRVRRGEHDLTGVPADLLPHVERCLAPEAADRPELAAVLSSLRGRPPAPAAAGPVGGPVDEPTMPFALASPPDEDGTEVLGDDAPTVGVPATSGIDPTTPLTTTSGIDPTTPLTTAAGADPTTPYTTAAPAPATAHPGPSVLQPARAPYMTPAPPQTQVQPRPPMQHPAQQVPVKAPPEPWRPPPGGLARFQRGTLLLGLFALVAVLFAAAPYVSVVLLGVGALAVRTLSWVSESTRDRRWRRGGTTWYDGPLAVLTAPWYLVVATGGTLMLLLWSSALAFMVGVGFMLFRLPMRSGLLTMGAVLAFSLWWGPGSKRLRVPVRKLVVRTTARPWLGWLGILAVGALVALTGYTLVTTGTAWDPQPGPPWRAGTLLGDLRSFL